MTMKYIYIWKEQNEMGQTRDGVIDVGHCRIFESREYSIKDQIEIHW